VQFKAGSICGTDMHFYRGEWKWMKKGLMTKLYGQTGLIAARNVTSPESPHWRFLKSVWTAVKLTHTRQTWLPPTRAGLSRN
jgi:hypothetical protein